MLRHHFTRTFALLFSSVVLFSAASRAADETPTPDAKSDANQIPQWGLWQDPDADCKYVVEKKKLTLTVPGWEHDLSAERVKMNAPRIIQEGGADFAIQVKISGDFKPGGPVAPNRPAYQGAGVFIMLDNRNYIRLERAAYVKPNTTQPIHIMSFEARLNGAVQRFGAAPDNRVEANTPLYFRMERHGKKVYGAVSQDGEEWQVLDIKTLSDAPKLTTGIFAVNLSTNEFQPRFEEFKVEELEPIVEETEAEEEAPVKKLPPKRKKK